MELRRVVAASMLALQLSACGGGSEGVNSTPAPTPSPTASYTRIQDLTGNQTFVTASISSPYNSSGLLVPQVPNGYPFGAGTSTVTLSYDSGSDTYIVNGYGTTTFTQEDIVNSGDPKTIVLQKTSGGITTDILRQTTPSPGGIDLSYVRFDSWMTTRYSALNGNERLTYMVGGVPTLASDVPTTGTATFTRNSVIGRANDVENRTFYDLAHSTATLSADFGANTLQTALTLIGTPTAGGADRNFGTFNGIGTIGNGNPVRNRFVFGGTLTTNGPGNATFTGAFFGPQATEFGYVWSIFQSGLTAEGAVAGRR